MKKRSKLQDRNAALRFVSPAIRATQALSPKIAAAMAERLFFRVPPAKVSARGREFLARGQRFEQVVDRRRIVGWTWGSGPTVYVVHGWGGSSGRLYPLAEAVIDSGRRLVMFDAPGHGASAGGLSSMPEFARALRSVIATVGEPDSVIAHSLGAAATTLAASWGLTARRFVFVAPAANPAEWALAFGRLLRLSPDVMSRLRARSELRIRFNWDDLDARVYARKMNAPLLVLHDRGDETVPLSNGAEISSAWPGARLVETSGLGHSDILRDRAVIAQILGFIGDGRTHEVSGSGVQANTIAAE